jgi:tetratricopeptide (TPR) repeat protein
LLTLRKPSDAIQYAQKAVGLAPQSADAHYELGRAFLEQSDISEAVKELEAARHLAPKSPKVHFNLAKAYARANRVAEAAQERQLFESLKQEASQKRPSNRTSILTANPAALGSSVE